MFDSFYNAAKAGKAVSILVMFFGFLGVSVNAKILDSNYAESNTNSWIGTTKITHCPSLVGQHEKMIEFRELKDDVFSRCLMQNNNELSSLAGELMKVEMSGPVSGFLLSAYDEFNKKSEPKSCQDITVEMNQLCPELNL